MEYLAERFPLPVTVIHAMSTAGLLVGIAAADLPSSSRIGSSLLIAAAFLFFMLRMRVTDEFKDRRHDNHNYPNRPVQRGLISPRALISMGVTALTLELIFAYSAGFISGQPISIFWHLAILGFSVLTHFEFFAKAYLEAHFNLYFFIHQLIFLLYPVWVFSIWSTPVNPRTLAGAISFVGYMTAMEIVRKYEIRLDPKGNPVPDTYLAVWGRGAFWIMFTLTLLGGAGLYYSSEYPLALIVAGITAIALLVKKSDDNLVRAIVAIGFITQSIGVMIWN